MGKFRWVREVGEGGGEGGCNEVDLLECEGVGGCREEEGSA